MVLGAPRVPNFRGYGTHLASRSRHEHLKESGLQSPEEPCLRFSQVMDYADDGDVHMKIKSREANGKFGKESRSSLTNVWSADIWAVGISFFRCLECI